VLELWLVVCCGGAKAAEIDFKVLIRTWVCATQLVYFEETICESVRDIKERFRDLERYITRIRVISAAQAEHEVEMQSAGGVEDCVAALELGLYSQRFHGVAVGVTACRI
jgi:tetrahydromethanopterin S-methyltransferase subunit B